MFEQETGLQLLPRKRTSLLASMQCTSVSGVAATKIQSEARSCMTNFSSIIMDIPNYSMKYETIPLYEYSRFLEEALEEIDQHDV